MKYIKQIRLNKLFLAVSLKTTLGSLVNALSWIQSQLWARINSRLRGVTEKNVGVFLNKESENRLTSIRCKQFKINIKVYYSFFRDTFITRLS